MIALCLPPYLHLLGGDVELVGVDDAVDAVDDDERHVVASEPGGPFLFCFNVVLVKSQNSFISYIGSATLVPNLTTF